MTWTWMFALALGTYAMRASAPLVLGSRRLPPLAERLGALVAVSLIAALVATSTVADGRTLHLDARVAGVGVGALAIWRGAPFPVVVVLAAATAGLLRFVGVG
ncbi:MAG TPA: AzlD domain-containing protein [Gaiellales bacterium]